MNNVTNENTVWHEPSVYRADREGMNGHKSVIIWFTGLSGSGKSSLSLDCLLEAQFYHLHPVGVSVSVPNSTLPITSF